MSSTHWHFRRSPFTQDTFTAMVNGPSRAFTLFGPRRIGKTEWLLMDLADVAGGTYGHRVAYASFWEIKTAPLNVLLYRLAEALEPRSIGAQILSWGKALPLKAKIKSPDGLAEIELDLSAQAKRAEPKDLLLLDAYIKRLANADRPAFLLFDEFQELPNHPDGAEIVAALRTSLDVAGRDVVSVFTGSSMEGLKAMFTSREAPFFDFAVELRLPPLGEDFLTHQIKAFHQSFQRKLDPTVARAQFEAVGHSPEMFQRWLTLLGGSPDLTPEDASQMAAQRFASDHNYDGLWRGLNRLQRQMARLVAEEQPGLFGKKAEARLADWTPDEIPSRAQRQAGLRYLVRNLGVERLDHGYGFSDPAFARWILNRPETEFL